MGGWHGFRAPPANSSVQVPPPTIMIPRSPTSIATSILRGVLVRIVLDNILVSLSVPFTIVVRKWNSHSPIFSCSWGLQPRNYIPIAERIKSELNRPVRSIFSADESME